MKLFKSTLPEQRIKPVFGAGFFLSEKDSKN